MRGVKKEKDTKKNEKRGNINRTIRKRGREKKRRKVRKRGRKRKKRIHLIVSNK